MLAGAALCARRAACRAARARRPRCAACWRSVAFALLAAFTALSIMLVAGARDSWLETNRTLAYLAVFAGGARARAAGARALDRAARTASRSAPSCSCALGAADQGLPGVRSRPTRRSPACARRSTTGTASG